MKKRLLALLLAGAMSVGLAACGNSGDEGSANTPAGGETTPVTDGTGEPSAEGKTVKVGMVCIGDENDQGYTYNFMKAVEEATAQLAERGITVEWSYKKNILEDSGCEDANIELAEARSLIDVRAAAAEEMVKRPTPGKEKCHDVAEFLGIPFEKSVKSVVLAADRTDEKGNPLPAKIVLILLRADHDLNEVKAGHLPELKDGFRFATDAEILENFGSKPGYLGPVGIKEDVAVYADLTVANMSDFCCGANEEGYHYTGVNFGRDLPEPKVADLRNVVEGDASPDGKGMLRLQRGIEVGHVFYLGTKYSEALNATYLDENGQPKVLEMGCYGIGVTRLAGAAIEQSHDERGIIWPDSIAPFEVVICPMNYSKSEAVREAADRLYEELKAQGVDVILDDRDMRPGVMFADWELIGVPHRVVIGDRGLKNGEVEYANRRNLAEKVMVKTEEAVEFVTKQIKR